LTLQGGKCLNPPSILIPVATPILCPFTSDPKETAFLFSKVLFVDGKSIGIELRED
jgi:hypothetical protein